MRARVRVCACACVCVCVRYHGHVTEGVDDPEDEVLDLVRQYVLAERELLGDGGQAAGRLRQLEHLGEGLLDQSGAPLVRRPEVVRDRLEVARLCANAIVCRVVSCTTCVVCRVCRVW